MQEDRRHPRRPFDPVLIESYLLGRTVERAELLPLGKSNTNYRLTLTGGEVCVLRLHNRSANSEREHAIFALVKDIVPVPEVLARGDDWSILSFLEGTVLADAPEGTRAAAEALAALASLRFLSAGWIQADGSVAPFEFGDGKRFFEAIMERAEVRTWIGLDAIKALRVIDTEQSTESDSSNGPCLVHGDFNPTNILVRNGVVTGILDWEFAHAGGPYMDIGNLLRHTAPAYQDQIAAGLAAGGRALPPNWKKKAELVDLGSHLEFLTTQRSDDFKRQCVQWIHGFIARYQNSRNSCL